MSGSTCCPPESTPYLKDTYLAKGSDLTTPEGFNYYTYGSSTSIGLILISDVFGYRSGRMRNIADFYADAGMTVLGLPPTFDFGTRGADFLPWVSNVTWDRVQPRVQASLQVLQSKGVSKIAMIGFCWGGWVVVKSCVAFPAISVACIGHPTIHLEEYAYKGNTAALAAQVRVPILLLPAGGDPDIYRPGGAVLEALKTGNPKSSSSDHFGDMVHGWIPRGDVSDPKVDAKVRLALDEMLSFVNAHI